MLKLVLLLAFAPLPASAASEQMLRILAQELPFLGIEVDVTTLTNAQVAAIWFELNSRDYDKPGDELGQRRRIRAILRWDERS